MKIDLIGLKKDREEKDKVISELKNNKVSKGEEDEMKI